MRIQVQDRGSFFEFPITVQGGYWDDDSFEMEWCNHAGAYQTNSDFWYAKDNGGYEEVTEKYYICDKCDETWEMDNDDYEYEKEDF